MNLSQLIKNNASIEEIKTFLLECPTALTSFDPKKNILLSWDIEDVQGMEGYEHLTDSQAFDVLGLADRYHDAEMGINWDVLAVHADNVLSEI